MSSEVVLQPVECHFVWGLEEFGNWTSNPIPEIERLIVKNNKKENLETRFFGSCLMAYMMYKSELSGWKILLTNVDKILKFAKDPSAEKPALYYPSYTDNLALWAGSWNEFNQVSSKVDIHLVNHSECAEGGDVSFEDEEENDDDLADVLWVAANHVFQALSASIESSTETIDRLMKQTVVLVDDMSDADKSALLMIRAHTTRYTSGVVGLPPALKLVKQAVRVDPDNAKWVLILVQFTNYLRQQLWGQDRDDEESALLILIIDGVLSLSLKRWMETRFKYEKLRLMRQLRSKYDSNACCTLAEEILESTNKPSMRSYCAQLLSTHGTARLHKAKSIIDDLIERDPNDVMVLAKGSNIYKTSGDLFKALELAERASKAGGYGSCWQVLNLKIRLRRPFSPDEFFADVLERFNVHLQRTHTEAFLFYVCKTENYSKGISHFEELLKINGPGANLGGVFCSWILKKVDLTEAAYNVCLFASKQRPNISQADLNLFKRVQKAIEESSQFSESSVDPSRYMTTLKKVKHQNNKRGYRK